MADENLIQYMSSDKLMELKAELADLKNTKIPELAKKIDDARQHGDLSENAEYHNAREEMAWARSRIAEIEFILKNAKIVTVPDRSGLVSVGSKISVKINGVKKDFIIVGAQEADPVRGRISNESPLGHAFLGKKKGDRVQVKIPAGIVVYEILFVD